MNAVVSGRAGVALLLEPDGQLFSIHQGDLSQAVPRRPEDFRWLLGDATDLEFYDGVESRDVHRLLDFAAQREEALDIALTLLDRDLPEAIRTQAAEDLEECFAGLRVQDAVESVFCASPLPEDADLETALRAALTQKKVNAFLQLLCDRQPIIRKVRQAWESVDDQYFGGRPERRDAQALGVRAGLFCDLVRTLADGKEAGDVVLGVLARDPKLRRFQTALERWAKAVALEGRFKVALAEEMLKIDLTTVQKFEKVQATVAVSEAQIALQKGDTE